MPTNRTRKKRTYKSEYPDYLINHLQTGHNVPWENYIDFCFDYERRLKEIWNKDIVMRDFVVKQPGKRPFAWWNYDAPRWDDPFKGWYIHGTLTEMRKRLDTNSDIVPSWECINDMPLIVFGIPERFLKKGVEFLHSEVSDDELKNILFESEASYLKRHELLNPGEENKLSEDALKPETAFEILLRLKNEEN